MGTPTRTAAPQARQTRTAGREPAASTVTGWRGPQLLYVRKVGMGGLEPPRPAPKAGVQPFGTSAVLTEWVVDAERAGAFDGRRLV